MDNKKTDGTFEENFKANFKALGDWEKSEEGKRALGERRVNWEKLEKENNKKNKKKKTLTILSYVIGIPVALLLIGIIGHACGIGPSDAAVKNMLDTNNIPYK